MIKQNFRKKSFYTDLIHIEDYDRVVYESLDKLSKSELSI
jgi:hypothetical protein